MSTITPTELRLMALHRALALRLDDICEQYLGVTATVARKRAIANDLPFPTYRATDSAKAPFMVDVRELANHIDTAGTQAREQWGKQQRDR